MNMSEENSIDTFNVEEMRSMYETRPLAPSQETLGESAENPDVGQLGGVDVLTEGVKAERTHGRTNEDGNSTEEAEDDDNDTDDSDSPSLNYELQQGYRILKELMAESNKSVNWPFIYKVDDSYPETSDYYEKIKNPIWLEKSLRRRTRNIIPHDSTALLNQLREEEAQSLRDARKQQMLERKAAQEAYLQDLMGWERNMMDNKETEMRAMWELPQIGLFLFLCQEPLNTGEISQFELERCFFMPRESSTMHLVMTSLLSTPFQRTRIDHKSLMSYRVWEEKLRVKLTLWYKVFTDFNKDIDKAADKLGLDPYFFQVVGKKNPMEKKKFHEIGVYKREHQESLRDTIEAQPVEESRCYFLGTDTKGNSYIHFPQFCGADLRIYKQAPLPDPTVFFEELIEKHAEEERQPIVPLKTPIKEKIIKKTPSSKKPKKKKLKQSEIVTPPTNRPSRLRQKIKTVLPVVNDSSSSSSSSDEEDTAADDEGDDTVTEEQSDSAFNDSGISENTPAKRKRTHMNKRINLDETSCDKFDSISENGLGMSEESRTDGRNIQDERTKNNSTPLSDATEYSFNNSESGDENKVQNSIESKKSLKDINSKGGSREAGDNSDYDVKHSFASCSTVDAKGDKVVDYKKLCDAIDSVMSNGLYGDSDEEASKDSSVGFSIDENAMNSDIEAHNKIGINDTDGSTNTDQFSIDIIKKENCELDNNVLENKHCLSENNVYDGTNKENKDNVNSSEQKNEKHGDERNKSMKIKQEEIDDQEMEGDVRNSRELVSELLEESTASQENMESENNSNSDVKKVENSDVSYKNNDTNNQDTEMKTETKSSESLQVKEERNSDKNPKDEFVQEKEKNEDTKFLGNESVKKENEIETDTCEVKNENKTGTDETTKIKEEEMKQESEDEEEEELATKKARIKLRKEHTEYKDSPQEENDDLWKTDNSDTDTDEGSGDDSDG
ncbi:hypothetical protein KUTeg_022989 [Tegillarca granosa]|uniref:Uncharacterized bromodomain-containing protein 10 helical domain-containing protein n=1 Tax=Tegillarca granosa TaxID=220873 RepID=A0ABQ9E0S5_TEGGR|nr:hypothetical protein KUTeg_022989 [Tegillarca granosa]